MPAAWGDRERGAGTYNREGRGTNGLLWGGGPGKSAWVRQWLYLVSVGSFTSGETVGRQVHNYLGGERRN